MGAGASTGPDATLFTGDAASKGITFDQLEAAVAQQPAEVRARWSSEQLRTAFQQHDGDGDGFLSAQEYDAALAAMGGSGSAGKDYGRDLPGAAEAAGMRQENEEAIDAAFMVAPSRKWSSQQVDEATMQVACVSKTNSATVSIIPEYICSSLPLLLST